MGAQGGILCMWKANGGLAWKARQGERERNIIKAVQLFKRGQEAKTKQKEGMAEKVRAILQEDKTVVFFRN